MKISFKVDKDFFLDEEKQFKCNLSMNNKKGKYFQRSLYSFERKLNEGQWEVVYERELIVWFWNYKNQEKLIKAEQKIFNKVISKLVKFGLNEELIKLPWNK